MENPEQIKSGLPFHTVTAIDATIWGNNQLARIHPLIHLCKKNRLRYLKGESAPTPSGIFYACRGNIAVTIR